LGTIASQKDLHKFTNFMFLVWPCVGAIYSYCLTRISYLTLPVVGPGLFNSSIFNGGIEIDQSNISIINSTIDAANMQGISDEEQMARLQELMNERMEQ
jgi:hypothetical protein